jgi:hypothetical protein
VHHVNTLAHTHTHTHTHSHKYAYIDQPNDEEKQQEEEEEDEKGEKDDDNDCMPFGLPPLTFRALSLDRAFVYDAIYLTIFWTIKGMCV